MLASRSSCWLVPQPTPSGVRPLLPWLLALAGVMPRPKCTCTCAAVIDLCATYARYSACTQPIATATTTCRRYNRILAPQLRVFDDQRINLRQVDLDFDLN